jgi:hypothetical protein
MILNQEHYGSKDPVWGSFIPELSSSHSKNSSGEFEMLLQMTIDAGKALCTGVYLM